MSTRAVAPTVAAPVPVLAPLQRPMLQRSCDCGQHTGSGECEECKKQRTARLQRHASAGAQSPIAPAIVHEVLNSPGQPLDSVTRALMEQRFRYDFSGVRVHNDQRAADSARAVSAHAYTVGPHVVFGAHNYAPQTSSGRYLLAHELTHVVQQDSVTGSGPLTVSAPGDDYEREAERVSSGVLSDDTKPLSVAPRPEVQRWVQRFSEREHKEIGQAAYDAAPPKSTSASAGPHPEPLDPALVQSLKQFRYKHADGKESTYAQLVAMADNVASFQLMEDQDRERAGKGFRVPVLSRIWDWVGDETHYLDLASRNRAHFHPHNFMNWQAWHWAALASMEQAAKLEAEADQLNVEITQLFKDFNERSSRVHDAIEGRDRTGEKSDILDQTITREVNRLAKEVEQIQEKQAKVATLRTRAKDLAVHAMAVNGFGDHFLTDAYAGGHIVTPRQELLDDYSTKLLGFIKVGGVLHCANIPSLAWHDLDNKFGVRVKNRRGQVWTTYGDNYLHHAAPKKEPTTFQQVVEATTHSVRHMWQTAAGRKPTSLMDVLHLLPAPKLDPGIYPSWKREDWQLQLRYAAGEPVGADYSEFDQPGTPRKTPEKVPNPKGEQIGSGPLSGRATCVNLLDVFSYDKFVVPMIQRVRKEYDKKFFSGRAEQILPPTARPEPQDSVTGHVAVGSLLGGLGGALIGLAAGGVLGAVIGGIAGLVIGGFIGGFIGNKRKDSALAP